MFAENHEYKIQNPNDGKAEDEANDSRNEFTF